MKFCIWILLLAVWLLPQVRAQDVLVQNTDITGTETYSGNSITAGPGVVVGSMGEAAFAATSFVALQPTFVVQQGGTLRILVGDNVTPTEYGAELPATFVVHGNYPNPFNPETVIRYSVPQPGIVTIRVYDQTGRLVAAPQSGRVSAGRHDVRFKADGLASGVYLYTVAYEGRLLVGRMSFLK